MHAMVIHRHGEPEVLEAAEIPTPAPAQGEALIRVHAVSVNAYLDVTARAEPLPWIAPFTFPHVLGSEHVGEVAGYGPGTDGPFPVGTQVVVRNTVFCGRCDMSQARIMLSCSVSGLVTWLAHFTIGSTSRCGPPTMLRLRYHCEPGSIPGLSP